MEWNMQKTAIRTVPVPCQSSKLIMAGLEPQDIRGMDPANLLETVFAEQIPLETLQREYDLFSQGQPSSCFAWMYVIGQGFGVILDEHITLCRFDQALFDLQQMRFPWGYVESQKYLGDAWWFSEEEILHDLQTCPMIPFLEKYKGL